MRLTDKNATRQGTTIGFPNAIACYWKLKDLEDIEDELGIELITLFKALKDGFYYKGKEKKCRFCYVSACFGSIELKNAGILYSTISNKKYFYFKDYGKTWALTKEELL